MPFRGVPYLIWLLQGQLTGRFPAAPVGLWAFWILLNLAPVLAMAAFHRNAPAPPRPGFRDGAFVMSRVMSGPMYG